MKNFSPRLLYSIGFLLCVGLLLASYYFEFVQHMQPCLLCILQRFALLLLAIIFVIAALHAPQKWGCHVYTILLLFSAGLGIFAASRQVWLQHQPPMGAANCLPGLAYLLQTCPLPQVIQLMFKGGPDCAEAVWRFWGLSMAEWTLIFFVSLVMYVVWIGMSCKRSNPVAIH